MPLIDTNHQRAALLVLLLGVALVIALTPYATGLIGIPVLYAIFAPVHEWLCMRMRPKLAATVVVLLALFLIVRSEEHTSELQSPCNLVCRLLLEKKKNTPGSISTH